HTPTTSGSSGITCSYLPAAFCKHTNSRIPTMSAISGKLTCRWGSNLPIGIHELDRQRRNSSQNQSAGNLLPETDVPDSVKYSSLHGSSPSLAHDVAAVDRD